MQYILYTLKYGHGKGFILSLNTTVRQGQILIFAGSYGFKREEPLGIFLFNENGENIHS